MLALLGLVLVCSTLEEKERAAPDLGHELPAAILDLHRLGIPATRSLQKAAELSDLPRHAEGLAAMTSRTPRTRRRRALEPKWLRKQKPTSRK